MKRLAIIDGKSVFYRGYYAMPNLATKDGTPTGGVYGFAALSLELIKKLQPDYVCVAWDKPKTNIRKRREIYPEYKAGRKPAPPDFYAQIPILQELLQAFSWPLYELDDYEADDIMGTLSRQAENESLETCLISSDLDMLQCLAPNTHMYALKKGFTDIELFKPEYFEQKYGIRVDQFLDLKALKGDSSDNIPGVPGIGEKGGVTLLQKYETLDGIYEHIDEITGATQRKLIDGKDSAYLSREVASIMFDAPLLLDLPAMDIRDLDTAKLHDMLKDLEFNSLLRSLPEHMQATETSEKPQLVATEKTWDSEQKTAALMAERVLLQKIGKNIYISSDPETFAKIDATGLAPIIKNVRSVTHDGHALCHFLLDADIELPDTIFDLRQGGFLLNPLRSSRTLADITGYDGDNPAVIMPLLWQAFDEQQKSFVEAPRLQTIADDIDFPLIPILAKMEYRGIKLDTGKLKEVDNKLANDLEVVEKEIHRLAGIEFNINSPSQVSEILFERLNLPTDGIKKTRTGFYSTDVKTINKLIGFHIVEQLSKHREISKLKHSYTEALPPLVDAGSIIHTTFNQDQAATGRLSSDNPNLQQIPKKTDTGREVASAFVPRAGNVFVGADYSQFELRLAAVLAGDDDMINAFNSDIDIHTKTAADVHGIPLDQVTKAQRRDAKVVNFGVLYGMGPHALAENTGMSFGAAKQFIDEYFKQRHKIRDYIDNTIRQAREGGYVETFYGRRRPTPDVQSSNFIVRQSAERAAANMPIQGTEADLMKRAMIAVEKKLGGKGEQILQIHDSIMVECPEGNAEQIGEMLKATMELIAPELAIKLKVDISIGQNWGEV